MTANPSPHDPSAAARDPNAAIEALLDAAAEAQSAARASDFEAWTRDHLGPAWTPAAADALYVDWMADCLERRPALWDAFAGVGEELDRGVTYFASGANHAGEIRGFANAGHDLGVAVCDLDKSGQAEAELLLLAGGSTRVFVDSGAFGEVRLTRTGPTWPNPISDEEWRARLTTYRRLARELQTQLYCVAPDRVADQAGTLERLRRYADRIRELATLGANVIVPVQAGTLTMAEAWEQALVILGPGTWVAGVPSKKRATSETALHAFICDAKPARVHLLGLGRKSKRFAGLIEAIRTVVPAADISCDSVRLKAMVGRTNGPGGRPRALTVARDHFLAAGITDTAKLKAAAAAAVLRADDQAQLMALVHRGWAPRFGGVVHPFPRRPDQKAHTTYIPQGLLT